jgi:voltage-gated potassium channel
VSPPPDDVRLLLRRLAGLVAGVVVLVLAGSVAFHLVEGVSLWDGFVWALDTVATVGSIVGPHDAGGEVIKVVLIVLGVGTLFYALVTLAELVVAGHVTGLLRERRERRLIENLADHYVICGFGRVGRQVSRDLRTAGAPHVVVDNNPASHEVAHRSGVPFIDGEPADDDTLCAAGIERARGVLACVDSDADNVFICLTARQLRPDVLIVARASEEDTEAKLKRAGADRVISPYKASGSEMARLALHPQVFGAVDVADDYRMEEIEVPENCPGVGRTIDEVRGGALIVALRRADGSIEPQPPADARLEPGDTLVALGTPRTLDRLEKLFEPSRAAAS